MATKSILEFFRSKEPRFRRVPDDQLVYYVGSKKKAFLKDEEFRKDYQKVLRGQLDAVQSPEGRQQVARQAKVEELGTIEQGVLSLQAGSKMLASNLALSGSRAVERAQRSSFGGFLAQVPGLGDLMNPVVEAAVEVPEAISEVAAESAAEVREVRDVLPQTMVQSAVNIVSEAAPSVVPTIVAGAVGGLPATVYAAAVTSYGSVLSDAEEELRNRGYDESEVRRSAHAEATVAGLATGLITAGFNKFAPGLEKAASSIFKKPTQVITKDGKTVNQFKKFVVDTLKGFGSEASEESLDETAQSMLEMYVRNPDMSAVEVAKRAGIAGLAGGVLGAGGAALTFRKSTTPQTDKAVKDAGVSVAPTEPLAESFEPEEAIEDAERINQAEVERDLPPRPAASFDPVINRWKERRSILEGPSVSPEADLTTEVEPEGIDLIERVKLSSLEVSRFAEDFLDFGQRDQTTTKTLNKLLQDKADLMLEIDAEDKLRARGVPVDDQAQQDALQKIQSIDANLARLTGLQEPAPVSLSEIRSANESLNEKLKADPMESLADVEEPTPTPAPEPSVVSEPVVEEPTPTPTPPVVVESPTRFEVTDDMSAEQAFAVELSNNLTDQVDSLNKQVESLQTQVSTLEEAPAQETTEERTDYQSKLKSQQRDLELKLQELEVKQTQALDAAKQVINETSNTSLNETPESKIEKDIKPETDSIFSLGIVSGPMSPSIFKKVGKRLGFNPDEMVASWPGRFIQKVRKFATSGDTAPSEFVTIRAEAKARRDSFVKLSKRYADELNKLIKAHAKKTNTSEEDILAQANQFMLGRKDQLNLLTPAMLEELTKSRNLIDLLSTRILDLGFLEGNLAKSIKQNIGSYLLRSYKVFDPLYDWENEVPASVRETAVEYITKEIKRKEDRSDSETESRTEAEAVVQKILDNPSNTQEWMMGKSTVNGIPLASFIKRKAIPKEIRDLMGEVRDPLQNIVKSTHRVADIVVAYEAQDAIAELGLEAGLFSTKPEGNRIYNVFETDGTRNKTLEAKYPSLAPLYASKEVAQSVSDFYGGTGGAYDTLNSFFKGIAKLTSIGKFSQVILSIQDSWTVNMLGAAMVEFANGRIGRRPGLTDKAAGGLATNVWRKFKGDKTRKNTKNPTPAELEKIVQLSGKEFAENWNTYLNQPVLAETLTSQYGALDENVLVNDIVASWVSEEQVQQLSTLQKKGFKAIPQWVKSKVFGKAGDIYSWPDNAMKVNAFFQEALDYANAYPDKPMSEIFRTAGDIARATTPVYSRVPKGLKKLNLIGIIPTYISFVYEMHRNVGNSVLIAKQEILSDNPIIKAKGIKRLVFTVGTMGLATVGMEGIVDAVRNYLTDSDDLDEQQQKDLTWLVAPWDRTQQLGMLNFKKGEEFTYANLSYQVPQAVITAPIVAAMRGEDLNDSFSKAFSSLAETWFGGSVLPSSVGEAVYNRKLGGGEIYNESLETYERIPPALWHITKNAFLPGFIKKIDRMSQAWEESDNSYGRIYSLEEETMRLFTLRPTTYNVPEAARFRMINFQRDYSQAAKFTSSVKQQSMTESQIKKADAKEKELVDRVKSDYSKFIQSMLRLGVTKQQLRTSERNLFKAEPGERRSGMYKDLRAVSAPLLR